MAAASALLAIRGFDGAEIFAAAADDDDPPASQIGDGGLLSGGLHVRGSAALNGVMHPPEAGSRRPPKTCRPRARGTPQCAATVPRIVVASRLAARAASARQRTARLALAKGPVCLRAPNFCRQHMPYSWSDEVGERNNNVESCPGASRQWLVCFHPMGKRPNSIHKRF